MSQCVIRENDQVQLEDSLSSCSDFDENMSQSITKSSWTDNIAKKIELSQDKVDQRMLKMHKIFKVQKLDLIDHLGVKDQISKSLLKGYAVSKMQNTATIQRSIPLRGLSEILDKEINGDDSACFDSHSMRFRKARAKEKYVAEEFELENLEMLNINGK